MQFDICPGCMRSPAAQGVCPSCGFDMSTYKAKSHHLPPYTIVDGKYLTGKVLGEGGFGITYLGWDMTLEIKVAIKEYFPAGFVTRSSAASLNVECSADERAEDFFAKGKERCLTEARTMAKCDGIAEVVRVRDFFQANNTVYIIMDFIEGVTLKQYLATRGGRIAMNDCISLLGPVMRAMDNVHRQVGLIHRDISPDNIMVLPDGRVRILDFGAAKSPAASQTRTTALMLKRGLSPIEQYSDSSVQGPWTDVYAMGATIYYCLTGTLPPEATERIENDTIVPPVHRGAVITRQQEWALMRALSVRAADRYQSMADFYRGLIARPQPVQAYPTQYAPPQMQPAVAPVAPAPITAAVPTAAVYTPTVQPVYQPPLVEVQTPPVKKKNLAGLIASIAAAVILLSGLGIGASIILKDNDTDSKASSAMSHLPDADDAENEDEDEKEDSAVSVPDDSAGLDEQEQLEESPAPDDSTAVFEPDNTPTELSSVQGGRTNNMINGNFFFNVDVEGQSYTLYYADSEMVHYREDDDGVVPLSDGETIMFLNYTDEGLYYIGYQGAQAQICFTAHGSAAKQVLYSTTNGIMYLSYNDGQLYFTENNSKICRIDKDGCGYTSLYSSGDIDDMACQDGRIYWLDGTALCSMPISGGEKTVLYKVADIYFFQFYNGRIYCVRDNDIIVLDEDGRLHQTLEISTYYFNIYKDVLYYADYDDHGIYAYDLAGEETVKLTDDHGGNPLRLCVGEYDGLVTIWFFYVDEADVSHAMLLVEQPDQWKCVYVDDLL